MLILCVIGVAVILSGYLVLCGTVCQGVMLPNTYVNGKDVSGMTMEEATAVAADAFTSDYADMSLTVRAVGKDYAVWMTNVLDLNAADLAQEAYNHGHGAFFSRGMVWILSHMERNARNILPHVAEGNALADSIEASGLLEVDSAVADFYHVSETEITFTKGTSGEVVDETALKDCILKAVDAGDYQTTIDCPMKTSVPKALDMTQVYEGVYSEPVNATLDPKKDYAVVGAVRGICFNKKEATAAMADLKEGESASVKLDVTQPEITTEDLKDKLFRDQLGSYSTNVSGTAARLSNVRLASQHCNGTILLPGDVFSYNDTVGQRTVARGFQKAGAYLNGESVQELGGGICQVSSTLYSATVLSNLEIVQRQNHTYESAYIPLGMDATVSWGGPDYRFKNSTEYPIKVVTSYSSGMLTCQIWGTKTDDIKVQFTHQVLSKTNYGTVKEEDSSMAEGTSVVSVTGENGYKVQSYREFYDGNGKLISKTKEAYSVYSKRNQVVKVGTKKKETKKTEQKTDKKTNKQKTDKKTAKQKTTEKTEKNNAEKENNKQNTDDNSDEEAGEQE